MPYWTEMVAVCPQCGTKATGEAEIEEVFGFRYDGTKPQSWCRSCRSLASMYKESGSCAYTECLWQDEYPKCEEEEKCPWL